MTSAQCNIGTEKDPDSAISLDYDDDSPGFGLLKESFRALTKADLLNPYIPDEDFRSSKKVRLLGTIYTFSIHNIRKT